MNIRQKIGKYGENLAVNFIENKGMKILSRNYRFDRAEIDIIALDNDELVFVEVKTRRSENYGFPESAVNGKKLEQIKKAAENFILEIEEKLEFNSVRIDVISILIKKEKTEIEHFENVY